MNCSEARRQLSAYLDGELAADVAAQVRAHLASCAPCRAELEFLKRLSSLTEKAFHEAPFDSSFVAKTFVKIKERRAPARRLLASRRFALAAACAVAAIAIVLFASFYFVETGHVPAAMAAATNESAFVRSPGSSGWHELRQDEKLYTGDVVKNCSETTVTMRTLRESKLLLNHNTVVQIGPDSPAATFELISGEVLAEVNKEPFRILCDGTTVSVKGTRFSVRKEPGRIVVTVIEGLVSCVSAMKEVQVGPGQQTVALAGRAPTIPVRVDLSRELPWVVGAAAPAPSEPAVAEELPGAPPEVEEPAAPGTKLPFDRPLSPPDEEEKK